MKKKLKESRKVVSVERIPGVKNGERNDLERKMLGDRRTERKKCLHQVPRRNENKKQKGILRMKHESVNTLYI